MTFLISMIAFGLLYLLRQSTPKILAKVAWILHAGLAIVGGAAFAESVVGNWFAGLIGGFFGWFGGLSWVGVSGALLCGGIAVILLVVAFIDLLDFKANSPAITALILMPLLFIPAGGPVADQGSQIYAAFLGIGNGSLGQLAGA